MSAVDPTAEKELVVAEDGSIPAEQLAGIGLQPGAHLRVVETSQPTQNVAGLVGSMPNLPDVPWEDFERGSDPAQRDLTASW